MQLLPLFFRLFRCQDKALRHMIFHHIIAGDLVIQNLFAWLYKSVVSWLFTLPLRLTFLSVSCNLR